MPLKAIVVEAFQTLEIDVETSQVDATRAYKKLALKHHPDKNTDDPSATDRFQKIGAAWNVVSRHYDDPRLSEQTFQPFPGAGYDDEDEDDDDFDLSFFMYMFQEEMSGRRFNRQNTRRNQGSGKRPLFQVVRAGNRIFVIPIDQDEDYSPQRSTSGGWADTFSSFSGRSGGGGHSGVRWTQPESSQKVQEREREEYEKRVRELEREVQEEERQKKQTERERAQAREALATAYARAFEAARRGTAAELKSVIESAQLDVNAPEKLKQQSTINNKKSNSPRPKFETMLHTAARSSSEGVLQYLLDKGADPAAENSSGFTPFHVSIHCGNASAVQFFLSRLGKQAEGCHPSKALADGRTPLQLAVSAAQIESVKLLVKDATVHDVQRLWVLDTTEQGIKRVLETKKGFTPDAVATDENGQALSKKALRKLEEQKKEAAKTARKAEDIRNLQRKLERKQKLDDDRKIMDEIKAMEQRQFEQEEAVRSAKEAVERRITEEGLRREDEDRKRQNLFQRKKQEEEETLHQEAALREWEAQDQERRDVERKRAAAEERARILRENEENKQKMARDRHQQLAKKQLLAKEEQERRKAEASEIRHAEASRAAGREGEQEVQPSPDQLEPHEHQNATPPSKPIPTAKQLAQKERRKSKILEKKTAALKLKAPPPPTEDTPEARRAHKIATSLYERRLAQSAKDRAKNVAPRVPPVSQASLPQPPMAPLMPEDVQTCTMADELFPRTTIRSEAAGGIIVPLAASTSPTSPTIVGSDGEGEKVISPVPQHTPPHQFRGKGFRGFRGRGRGFIRSRGFSQNQ